MAATLAPHQRAGRVIRLLGYLAFIGCVGIALAIGIPLVAQPGHAGDAWKLAPLLLILLVPMLVLSIGAAVKEHKPWGRVAGNIYGILLLFGFPIGTIAGVYVLWNLTKWDEAPAAPADGGGNGTRDRLPPSL